MLATAFTTHSVLPATNLQDRPYLPLLQEPAAGQPTDADLVACWNRFEPVLVRRLTRRGFGKQVARDAVTKVRDRAMRNIMSGWARTVSSHQRRCWAWRRATQWAITLTKRQRPDGEVPDADDGSFTRQAENEATEALGALVRAAALQLTPNRQCALHLRFYEDKSYQEIADALGISLESARDRIRGALTALAPVLAEILSRPEFEEIRGRFPRLKEVSE